MNIKCPRCHADNPPGTKSCDHCGLLLDAVDRMTAPPTKTLETSKEELTTGSTFAERYQIIEELGKGGMGRVYKAQDKEVNEKVALKLIKPEIAADKKTIERFRNELKLARKVRHKNVCQMYDLNKEEGSYYITMEFVSGQDLKKLIRQTGSLTVSTAVSIAKQVCEGLSEAHKLGVVHRDLKSNNIMIDEDGSVRIMDFGIARSLKAKSITGAGVMIGTPEYMSPEQVEGKEVDQRSDIYSLGIILYEMVTGQVPFEGDTPFTIGVKHKSEVPKNPKDLNSNLPDDLSQVILRCLEKDKDKRYRDAEELRSELINIEKGMPTTERKIVKTKSLTSKELTVTLSMRKLFLPAVIVLALVIAAVVFWQLLSPNKSAPIPSDKPSLAVMYFANNTGDESLDHWRSALPEWLITDLNQSKYLRVLSGDRLLNIFRKLNLMEAKSYDSRDLENVAREGAVNHILKASFSKAGETFRIDYSLQNASSWESIGSDYVSGKGEEGFPSMVDELTRKIKTNFNISADKIADDFDKEVETITTSSPEAYKSYMEGSNYHRLGEFRKAIESWERAVALDPEFSTAYRSMAIAYNNMGYISQANELLKKAMDLSDRVSEQEKYRIQAEFYTSTENTWDKAIEAFKKLLTHYPDNSAGNTNLGMLYAALEEWDKAIAQADVNIRNKEEEFFPYWVQAWAYMGKGRNDRSEEILKYFLDNYADHPFIRSLLAWNYLTLGEHSLALAEVEKSFLNNQDPYYPFTKGIIFLCKGDLMSSEIEMKKLLEMNDKIGQGMGWNGLTALEIYKGRFNEAEKNIRNSIKIAEEIPQPDDEILNRAVLIGLHLRTGNTDEALRECETAWNRSVQQGSYSGQIAASFLKGMIHVEERSLENAEVEAEKIKNLVNEWLNKKLIRYYYLLKGLIELKKENYSASIESFNSAQRFISGEGFYPDDHAIFLEPLAYVYFMMNDLEKAEEVFNKIISLGTGRFFYGDAYVKSFYMLGMIYEQKGWAGKAIENYEKFLDLWKDADPIFPEIGDAKTRLEALKN